MNRGIFATAPRYVTVDGCTSSIKLTRRCFTDGGDVAWLGPGPSSPSTFQVKGKGMLYQCPAYKIVFFQGQINI